MLKLPGYQTAHAIHTNMESSFEGFVAMDLTVKTDFELDRRFELQNISNFSNEENLG
jgi:hypothetical protein